MNGVLRTDDLYGSYFPIAAAGYVGLCLTTASSYLFSASVDNAYIFLAKLDLVLWNFCCVLC